MGDSVNSWQRQVNGLPQSSVLAETLFNLYSNDLPVTYSHSFIYSDDICCALQAETFSKIECTLTADLAHLAKYCQLWCLKPSTSKTVTSVFHLRDNSSLNVHMNVHHYQYPVYLGVSLDQTLSYREHLSRSAAKLKSRNNLIVKLAGTSWGTSTSTLRTLALALCLKVI